MISRIISGHQTGVDLGAIDAAISLNISHGGYVPARFDATNKIRYPFNEDGPLDTPYLEGVSYTDAENYPVRTRYNVEAGDQTVIFYRSELGRGSQLTLRILKELGKEYYGPYDLATANIGQTINELVVCLTGTVNWAGTRESNAPGIQAETFDIVRRIIKKQREIWKQ